jgi:hypothetical protein
MASTERPKRLRGTEVLKEQTERTRCSSVLLPQW